MENIIDAIFYSREKAENVLDKVKEIAHLYERVTLEDIKDVADLYAEPTDRFYWWMESMLTHSEILRVRNGWIIKLIAPIVDQDSIEKFKNGESTAKVTYRNYYSKKPTAQPKPTPKPLTITLDYAGIDEGNFDEILAKVFQYAQTITDRDVEINIC